MYLALTLLVFNLLMGPFGLPAPSALDLSGLHTTAAGSSDPVDDEADSRGQIDPAG